MEKKINKTKYSGVYAHMEKNEYDIFLILLEGLLIMLIMMIETVL